MYFSFSFLDVLILVHNIHKILYYRFARKHLKLKLFQDCHNHIYNSNKFFL